MSGFSHRHERVDAVLEKASAWALRIEDGDLSPSEREQLAQWLEADPEHQAAFDDANWALDAVGAHAAQPELMDLRERALAARPPKVRRTWGLGAIAAAAAASFALVWAVNNGQVEQLPSGSSVEQAARAPTVYRTAVGERASVTLPDGSIATLDTNSELRVAYDGRQRGVYLKQGQALFEVAKAKLPFQVYAKDERITAVGTTFNVRIDGERVRVALVEGTVRVKNVRASAEQAAKPVREMVLAPGEMLIATPGTPTVVRPRDVTDVTSWKGGQLVFNDVPLATAVSEINRYTAQPVKVADASIGAHRVSGVFKANDPRRFAMAMADLFPVAVKENPDGSQTLDASAGKKP